VEKVNQNFSIIKKKNTQSEPSPNGRWKIAQSGHTVGWRSQGDQMLLSENHPKCHNTYFVKFNAKLLS
jgi:hypothetical protein